MAKDNREILSTVRVGRDQMFGAGQEDELAAALSKEDGERLIEAGALQGDWSFTGKRPESLPRDVTGRLLRGSVGVTAAPAPSAPATNSARK
jgi:hypothetical protein